MDKKYTRWGKVKNFFKRNIYYVLLILCIAAIGAMIIVAATSGGATTVDADPYMQAPASATATVKPSATVNPSATDTPSATETPTETIEPVVAEPVIFTVPVVNATVGKEYSTDTLVYSSTLKEWRVHEGIDYMAQAGTEVVAVYAGTVKSIESDLLYGNTISIDHGDGLVTKYRNVSDNINVNVGDTVTKGQVIGEVGASGLLEINDGPHLHFETELNGSKVNPLLYFDGDANK